MLRRLDMVVKGSQYSIRRKKILLEREIVHWLHSTHMQRKAFNYMSVTQAFLNSIPQLTLQLYISVIQRECPLERGKFGCFKLKGKVGHSEVLKRH